MTRRIAGFVLLFMLMAGVAGGQDSGAPLKNSDILEMMQSGLGRRTIVLLIEQGTCNFDVSPQALMKLKKAGVKAEVIRAMVAASPKAMATVDPQAQGEALLWKALDSFGPRDALAGVHAMRWKGSVVETSASGDTISFEEDRIQTFPEGVSSGRVSVVLRHTSGLADKLVITPDFSYETFDRLTRAVGSASAEPYRQQIRFEPAYIAQHAHDYSVTVLGVEKKEDASVAVLKISVGDADYRWSIDSDTGRLLSIQYQMRSGEMVTREYSDYRPVGDLSFPFEWRTTEGGRTIETKVHEYAVNSMHDEAPFERPGNLSGMALSFRVLDTQSVAHGQELDGNMSTGCQLSQAANTSLVNPLDDVNFAEGTTPSNLQMTCNSWDTTRFWPRKLDAMLVLASDGNAYILTCDHGSRLSKCAPLHAGQVFQGRRTETGIAVVGVDVKGKEQEVTYLISQAEKLP